MNAELEALLVPFGLVMMRVGTFVATCPQFVQDSVPMSFRAALATILSISLTFTLSHFTMPQSLLVALINEMLMGGMLGASVRLTAVAVGYAGELFDINLGFSFARTVNPMIGEEASPMMHVSHLLGSVSFLLADGQRHVIVGLSKSFRLFEPGSGDFALSWPKIFASHLSEVAQAGLLLAFPIVLAMLCTQLGLALLSRLAPALNIWAVGLLGTCGMGLLALWCFLPAWFDGLITLWRAFDPFVDLLLADREAR